MSNTKGNKMTRKECMQAIMDGYTLINKNSGITVKGIDGKAIGSDGNEYRFIFYNDWGIYEDDASSQKHDALSGKTLYVTEEEKRLLIEALNTLEREESQTVFRLKSKGIDSDKIKKSVIDIMMLKEKIK